MAAARKAAATRTSIEPTPGDHCYVRRDGEGVIKGVVDVGKSPSAATERVANEVVKSGRGDGGDEAVMNRDEWEELLPGLDFPLRPRTQTSPPDWNDRATIDEWCSRFAIDEVTLRAAIQSVGPLPLAVECFVVSKGSKLVKPVTEERRIQHEAAQRRRHEATLLSREKTRQRRARVRASGERLNPDAN